MSTVQSKSSPKPVRSKRIGKPRQQTKAPAKAAPVLHQPKIDYGTEAEPLKLSLRQIDALLCLHAVHKDPSRFVILWDADGEPRICDLLAKKCPGGAISELTHGTWIQASDGPAYVQPITRYTLYYQHVTPLWYDLLDDKRAVALNMRSTATHSVARITAKAPKNDTSSEAKTPALAMCLCILRYYGFWIEVNE